MTETSASSTLFAELRHPPLVEVVCGVGFKPVALLDALELGIYWLERRSEYPTKRLLAPLSEGGGFFLGVTPGRAWFESPGGEYILQIQQDRFYMNWRSTGGHYPRFSDRAGTHSLKPRALDEFDHFARFCEARSASKPILERAELTKVDVLERGKHWSDLDDLARLLPVVTTFNTIRTGPEFDIGLRFSQQTPDGGRAFVHISSFKRPTPAPDAVRIEVSISSPVRNREELGGAWTHANDYSNKVFFGLIPPDQIGRFNKEQGG